MDLFVKFTDVFQHNLDTETQPYIYNIIYYRFSKDGYYKKIQDFSKKNLEYDFIITQQSILKV